METKSETLKGSLRAQLESARNDFVTLLESTTDAQWALGSANPNWTVGASFAHIGLGLGTVPLRMKSAREGKPKQVMPKFIFDYVNKTMTRKLGRQYNRSSVRQYFEDQFAIALRTLEGVEDTEWDLVSKTYVQTFTVRQIFEYQLAHFAEHLKDIRAVLGRPV